MKNNIHVKSGMSVLYSKMKLLQGSRSKAKFNMSLKRSLKSGITNIIDISPKRTIQF